MRSGTSMPSNPVALRMMSPVTSDNLIRNLRFASSASRKIG